MRYSALRQGDSLEMTTARQRRKMQSSLKLAFRIVGELQSSPSYQLVSGYCIRRPLLLGVRHACILTVTIDIELPSDFFDTDRAAQSGEFKAPAWMNEAYYSTDRKRLRRQLFLCLYMEFLLFNIDRRVYDLMLFAEKLQASGKLNKTRLIVPGLKRFRKWLRSIISGDAEAQDDQQIDTEQSGTTIYLGAAYRKKKDPDHLPPQSTGTGGCFRRFSKAL